MNEMRNARGSICAWLIDLESKHSGASSITQRGWILMPAAFCSKRRLH